MDLLDITSNLVFVCVIILVVAFAVLMHRNAELTANIQRFRAELLSLSTSMEEREKKNMLLRCQLLRNEEATRKLECEIVQRNRDLETLKSYGANLSRQVDKIQTTMMMKLQIAKFQLSTKLQGKLAVVRNQIKSIKHEMKMTNKSLEEKERVVNGRLEMHTTKVAAVEGKLDEIAASKSITAKDSPQTEARSKSRKMERGREEFGSCNYNIGNSQVITLCGSKRRAAIHSFQSGQIALRCTRKFEKDCKPNYCPGQQMLSSVILTHNSPSSYENLKRVIQLAFQDIQEDVRRRLTDEGFAKFVDLKVDDYIKNQDLLKIIFQEYKRGNN